MWCVKRRWGDSWLGWGRFGMKRLHDRRSVVAGGPEPCPREHGFDEERRESDLLSLQLLINLRHINPALPDQGCSWGLNPLVSWRLRAV